MPFAMKSRRLRGWCVSERVCKCVRMYVYVRVCKKECAHCVSVCVSVYACMCAHDRVSLSNFRTLVICVSVSSTTIARTYAGRPSVFALEKFLHQQARPPRPTLSVCVCVYVSE